MSTEDLDNKERTQRKEEDESAKLDRVVKNGEWMRLRDNKEYQEMSVEGKIIKAIDTVEVRIQQTEQMFYRQLAEDPQGSAVIHKKSLTTLRNLKKALGARFVGELRQEDAPEEMAKVLNIRSEERSQASQHRNKKAA